MILTSMTYKEMYDHLAADLPKIQFKMNMLFSKAVKIFRKTVRFPAWQLYDYKIPSTNNQYVIFFYAETRANVENPEANYFCILFDQNKRFIIKGYAGAYKHTPDSPITGIRQIHAYTSHFLERYNERFLKNPTLSSNEIALRYLSRNKTMMPLQQNIEINRNHEQYGVTGQYAFRVRDGICFAQSLVSGIKSEDGDRHKDKVDAMLILFTTFMAESKMSDIQRAAIEKEHCEKWVQFCLDFDKQAKDGVITLSLEP